MTLETSLEKRGVKYLVALGANPVKRGQDGEPDREVLWGGGRHFWVEFKKEKTGKLRPGQVVYTKYLRAIGDQVYVVDCYEELVRLADRWVNTIGPPTAGRDAAFR